jgi:hypothetical protein
MAADKLEKDAFLAAVEARIAAWTAVADSYRAALALDRPLGGESAPVPSLGTTQVAGYDLPVGVFRDKTIKEAIVIYLEAGRRKQTNKEIAIGLQKGGIATTAANFEATVATALGRLKDEGTILRFPDGWDLAASYPESLRGRLQKEGKPRKPVRAKRVRAPRAQKATANDGPQLVTGTAPS